MDKLEKLMAGVARNVYGKITAQDLRVLAPLAERDRDKIDAILDARRNTANYGARWRPSHS